THNFADDLAYVRALLKTPAAYIGMLGPRQRTERILRTLAAETQIEEGRGYGPVGLDIGTDGAEQVALSVIAEIIASRSGRRARSRPGANRAEGPPARVRRESRFHRPHERLTASRLEQTRAGRRRRRRDVGRHGARERGDARDAGRGGARDGGAARRLALRRR